jgi:hypothetical protein
MDTVSQTIWIKLMTKHGCKFDPPRQHPVNLEAKFEDIDDIERQMTIIPGFDRSDE